MSYLNTKQALIQQLLTVVSSSDVAFENRYFDPKDKDLWYAAYFMPVTTEGTGQSLSNAEEQRGFLQVSIFVRSNSADYDNIQLSKVDLILSAFKNTTTVSFSDQDVDILESTLNDGAIDDPWFKRDITINYLTFSNR